MSEQSVPLRLKPAAQVKVNVEEDVVVLDVDDVDEVVVDEPFGKKNPFPSPLLNSFDLNKDGSPRETYHIELSLKDSGLEYQVGDALGVLSHNPAQVVDEILPLLPFNVKDVVFLNMIIYRLSAACESKFLLMHANLFLLSQFVPISKKDKN